MSQLIVHNLTVSLDGYGAGPNQSKETPLGEGGEELHEWLVGTRAFMQMTGRGGGTTGIDNDFAGHGMANLGAFILGRNMFRAHPSSTPAAGDGGWHRLPLRDRRHSCRPRARAFRSRREGHPSARRSRSSPPWNRSVTCTPGEKAVYCWIARA